MKRDKVVVILGGNILNSGIVDYCKKQGYFVVVVDWSPNAHLKGDLFLCIDEKNYESIINALEENGIKNIMGAYSSIDLAVRSVNAINEHYGLHHMPQEALNHALPKSEMTRIWKEKHLLNRFSKHYIDWSDEIADSASRLKIIIKPNISASSRGITIIDKGTNFDVVKQAFDKARNESFDKTCIVEEFVVGREFTCEMLGDDYGNVVVYAISVKYHTLNTNNNKIAIKLHYNSEFYGNDTYRRIAELGKKCYRSLGFKASLGHLEILMKEDGTFSPVEIGARSSGFITNPLVSLASGQDFFGDYLKIINGGKVADHDHINGANSSMYFFYDMPHGTEVINPCSLMDFLPEGIESMYSNREKIMEHGHKWEDITNDNERIGYEILYGERHLMTISNIKKAEKEFIKNNTGYEIL